MWPPASGRQVECTAAVPERAAAWRPAPSSPAQGRQRAPFTADECWQVQSGRWPVFGLVRGDPFAQGERWTIERTGNRESRVVRRVDVHLQRPSSPSNAGRGLTTWHISIYRDSAQRSADHVPSKGEPRHMRERTITNADRHGRHHPIDRHALDRARAFHAHGRGGGPGGPRRLRRTRRTRSPSRPRHGPGRSRRARPARPRPRPARRSIPDAARRDPRGAARAPDRGADARLPADAGAERAKRRTLASERRLDLSHAPAARGRGPRRRRDDRWPTHVRTDRRGPSRRERPPDGTSVGDGPRAQRPPRAHPRSRHGRAPGLARRLDRGAGPGGDDPRRREARPLSTPRRGAGTAAGRPAEPASADRQDSDPG